MGVGELLFLAEAEGAGVPDHRIGRRPHPGLVVDGHGQPEMGTLGHGLGDIDHTAGPDHPGRFGERRRLRLHGHVMQAVEEHHGVHGGVAEGKILAHPTDVGLVSRRLRGQGLFQLFRVAFEAGHRRPAAGHQARQAAVAAAHVEDAGAREVEVFRDDVTVVPSCGG